MLDIKFVRNNPEVVKQNIKNRNRIQKQDHKYTSVTHPEVLRTRHVRPPRS